MKIVITESQIKSLKESLLLEASDDALTYTTKYDQKLYRWDYTNRKTDYYTWQNIPAGTKFKYTESKSGYSEIVAWGVFRFRCIDGLFDNIKTDVLYSDKLLKNALKNKFCNGELTKTSVLVAYEHKSTQEELTKIQDQSCINVIKGPYQNAVNWWKNKLNEPAFYYKLKKLNNYTDLQTKEWIQKYKTYITNSISGPFCPKKTSKYYQKNFSDGFAAAHLEGSAGASRIVLNTDYKNIDSKELEGTLVHEIQHALYDLKPMTPSENWKKVFPYKVWVNNDTQNSKTPTPQEKTTISKYGIKQDKLNWWSSELKRHTDPSRSDDTGYVCRETELASRMVKIKFLLGYSTNEKITVSDFKKFIEHEESPYDSTNPYFLVLCWLNNGTPDIQTFLDNLDKYVVAKVEPKKDDDMKDQTT